MKVLEFRVAIEIEATPENVAAPRAAICNLLVRLTDIGTPKRYCRWSLLSHPPEKSGLSQDRLVRECYS